MTVDMFVDVLHTLGYPPAPANHSPAKNETDETKQVDTIADVSDPLEHIFL